MATTKAAASEEGIVRRSWIKFRKELVFAMYTPFIVCLASRNLSVETFRHYIAQDVLLRRAFVHAYELAEECADDDEAKSAICELRKGVMEEMKMHDLFMDASALQMEDLLDKLSVSLTGEELEVIEKLYHQAMKLEIDFFSAQTISQQTIDPLSRVHDPVEHRPIIFSDFDLTCTVVDSSAILAEIAIITAPKADQSGSENQLSQKSSADLRNTWGDLSSQYTEEYEQCIESILPVEKVKEFDYEGLCKALEQLSDFEKRSNSRVIESGLLKGLNLEDLKRAGERLILQDGCTGFFQKIVKNEKLNADVHIFSYC